jgi:hypothetical protein
MACTVFRDMKRRWVAALLLVATVPGAAQLQPRGVELQLNRGTSETFNPSLTAANDGRFVVVWLRPTDTLFVGEARSGLFNPLGEPIGEQFTVSELFFFFFDGPIVGGAPDGRSVVVWPGGSETDEGGIRGQRLDTTGGLVGAPFQVNAFTTNGQYLPALAVQPDGAFMVVWRSYEQDGYRSGLFGRTFDSAGVPTSGDFQVDAYTEGWQREAAVAALRNGEFVVAWNGPNPSRPYSTYSIFSRRFDSSGAAQAAQLEISDATSYSVEQPAVEARDDGAFVVVWLDFTNGPHILGKHFNSSGSQLGDEFIVETSDEVVNRPAIAMNGTGEFLVVWETHPFPSQVLARGFDADANALGPTFQVAMRTAADNRNPDVANVGVGRFVVVWQRFTPEGEYNGRTDIVARRLTSAPLILDIDGDGEAAALTDAVLLLRQRLSFTGSALTAGAVGVSCTRCEPAEVESYIASIFDQLDADGDGTVGAFTDALLVLRLAFGFRGEALVAGATGEGCTRCDAESITAFLAPLFA